MSSLSALTYGLGTDALGVIRDALKAAYGDLPVEIVELQKSDLRLKIRRSGDETSVVLVVLDPESTETGRSADRGLYASDKFVTFTGMEPLVGALNRIFKIELKVSDYVEEEVVEVDAAPSGSAPSKGNEYYESIISNLQAQLLEKDGEIADLYSTVPEVAPVQGIESTLQEEGNKDLRRQLDLSKAEVLTLQGIKTGFEKDLEEAQVLQSRTAGVLRQSEKKLTETTEALTAKGKSLEEVERKLSSLQGNEDKVRELRKEVATLTGENRAAVEAQGNLEVELRTLRTTTTSTEELEAVRQSLDTEREGARTLTDKVTELETDKAALETDLTASEGKVVELTAELNGVKTELKESLKDVTKLNKDLLSKQQLLNQVNSGDGEMTVEAAQEVTRLKTKVSELTTGVFYHLSQTVSPTSKNSVRLLPGGNFENLNFVFAGNDLTTHAVGRFVSEKLKQSYANPGLGVFAGFNPQRETLVIEVTSDAYTDYIYSLASLQSGTEWFYKGGSLANYVQKTRIPKISTLSLGVGFVNEAYFLTVDWASRLSELNRSQYNIVVVAGSLSGLVPRMMYESFSQVGKAQILVDGKATSLRNTVVTLSGLGEGLTAANTEISITGYMDSGVAKRNLSFLRKYFKCYMEDSNWNRKVQA